MATRYVTANADEAWAILARIYKRHALEPNRWDEPDRVKERTEAHARFLALFEALP